MTNPGKQLQSLRKIVNGSCVVCEREFAGYVGKKYCSNRCAQRAKYQRNKSK